MSFILGTGMPRVPWSTRARAAAFAPADALTRFVKPAAPSADTNWRRLIGISVSSILRGPIQALPEKCSHAFPFRLSGQYTSNVLARLSKVSPDFLQFDFC